jgi:hypothetical protein
MTDKFCKDCKFLTHYPVYGSEFVSSPCCGRPNRYTGLPIRTSLGDERTGLRLFGWCGPKGKYFEPRAEETRTFKEYYEAYKDEVYRVTGSPESAVRLVLDLAGVKYTD